MFDDLHIRTVEQVAPSTRWRSGGLIRAIEIGVERFARWVLAYHRCSKELGTQLFTGDRAVPDWPPSAKPHDWLGRGIYFWEHGPERAAAWAHDKHGDDGVVVGAIIQLGRCFDLLDIKFTSLLRPAYEQEAEDARTANQNLPINKGPDADLGGRYLDCRVINRCLQLLPDDFQTVRGAFWEGDAAFPGAMIRRESHIQIAVRDPRCILGVFRPT